MADLFTARNWPIAKAPKRIELLGDKTARPEPAQHIIEFPGGAIELSRTSDGDYWAHIIVNRDWALDEMRGGLRGAIGQVVASRVMRPGFLAEIPDADGVSQIAVLIRSDRVEG